jgi:hypothetical protein
MTTRRTGGVTTTAVVTKKGAETVVNDMVTVIHAATLRTRRELQAYAPHVAPTPTLRAYIVERMCCDELIELLGIYAHVLGSLDNATFTQLQKAHEALSQTIYAQRHKYGPNRS